MRNSTLITLFLGVLMLGTFAEAQAQNCLSGFSYTREVTIHNSNTDTLKNHQVQLDIATDALVTAGKMQASGADIRFTFGDCCNFLCHTVESGMNTASTLIWVNVPEVLPNDSVNVIMAYGNPAAMDTDDAECTFDFFDGFDAVTTKFTSSCGNTTFSTSAGKLDLSWSSSGVLVADSIFDQGEIYVAEMDVTAASGNWPGLYWNNTSDSKGYSMLLGSGTARIGVATTSASNYCRSENWASSTISYTGV
ncbi:MAG: DUF2341 domain-containing protein, partial [Bacteroidota bacterium]